jgi:hypothetical protein
VVTGYLGAAPSLLWVSGALAIVFAPVLVPVAVWIYTLVFAFSSLWYAHYALEALKLLRLERDHAGAALAPGSGTGAAPLLEHAVPPGAPPASPGTPMP